jgi:hypothetical protein
MSRNIFDAYGKGIHRIEPIVRDALAVIDFMDSDV